MFQHLGLHIVPKRVSLDAFKFVFQNPREIIDAYLVTIFITVAGTSLGLVLMLSFPTQFRERITSSKTFCPFTYTSQCSSRVEL